MKEEKVGLIIQKMAVVLCVIEFIACLVTGVIIIAISDIDGKLLVGTVVMVVGMLFAFVLCMLLYGYGEIINKLDAIERNTCRESAQTNTQYQSDETDEAN